MSAARREFAEFDMNWRVVLASVVGIGLDPSPVPCYTIGMPAPQLAMRFHWEFGQIMAGLTIMTVIVLLVARVAAAGVLAEAQRIGGRAPI